jgi:head-tail adaptor
VVGIKERVTIEMPSVVQDTYGSGVREWTVIVEDMKATVMPVGVSEAAAMDRTKMEWTHRAWFDYYAIRAYLSQVKPSGRVKIGEEYYDIVGIERHGKRIVVLTLRLSV